MTIAHFFEYLFADFPETYPDLPLVCVNAGPCYSCRQLGGH
jgi:hypothetical protein